jgi:hypothetical protein
MILMMAKGKVPTIVEGGERKMARDLNIYSD